MEQTAAPPPQPPPSAVTTTAAIHTDTVDSSPRCRTNETWLEDTAVASTAVTAARGGGSKLRLMCSYGGHIVPRPHDKSLCYVGGDTRIVTVDRSITVSKLVNRLTKTLIRSNGTVTVTATAFTVKYQLPNEDLDSLISVTTDEDLENLIDEYDRLNLNINSTNSRIRLFLFPNKPESVSESVSSIGSLLESATKSEDWFVNALNGTTSSGFSDTSSFNCLLGLDDETVAPKKKEAVSNKTVLRNNCVQDVQSVPDSPILETSSFGSASSLGNLNLPGVQKGIEEQFSQISVQDVNLVLVSAPEPVPVVITGVPIGSKAVQQPQQYQQKQSVGFDMVSPDSVSSDGSVTNPLSRRKPAVTYTDPIAQTQFSNNNTTATTNNRLAEMSNVHDQTTRIPIQQPPPPQVDSHTQHAQGHHQPQFIHTAVVPPQYIHHHPSGAVPMTSYYQMYPPQSQHHAAHPPLDQHNYVYYMPARQPAPPQGYALPLQVDNSPAVSGPPTSQVPAPSSLFTTPRTVQTAAKTEQPYRTANTGAPGPQLVQVPSSQHQIQPQYVGYSVAPGIGGNYAYEYTDSSKQGQHIYYAAQPLPPQSAPQFQTMASTLPVEAQTGSHIQTDNSMKQQQVRTSQP